MSSDGAAAPDGAEELPAHRAGSPLPAEPSRKPALSPFQKLARLHALVAGADAVIAVSLAGSIFFSISPDAARSQVVLYLILTVAPFAVVTPFLGPVIDGISGGRRAMLFATTAGRCCVALLMIGHLETLWLFPEAFTLLVLQKGYAVAKSAVVTNCVSTESDLVEANSRLALLSALMSSIGAGVGVAVAWLGGPPAAAVVATAGYGFATLLTIRLPATRVASSSSAQSYSSLAKWAKEGWGAHNKPVLLAASAMAIMRSAVGFVTFMVAFELRGGAEGIDVSGTGAPLGGVVAYTSLASRRSGMGTPLGDAAPAVEDAVSEYLQAMIGTPGPPPWHFGVVAAAAALSAFVGVRGAPTLRRHAGEEMILLCALSVGFATAALAAVFGGLMGLALLAAGVSAATTAGKLAFDSLVQRDLPESEHGRFFAKFEARFQIAWVIGAFVPVGVPVLMPLPPRIGVLLVACVLGFATVFFVLRSRSALHTTPKPPPPLP